MPGIAGIISKTPREKNEEDLRLMIDCMMYEPFYTSGTYVNDQLGLYAGWVCHKGSFSDCMPIWNEKGDLLLIFAGENFVGNEVTDQLKQNGHEFEALNASYLIHLYEEKGERFIHHLNGWFSGILLDLQKEKIILFNDRYGIQRIYYYESKDAFIFSSEAKSLLRIRAELRKIDMRSLGEYFTCGCVMQNKTLFSNVFLTPGGSFWTFYNCDNVRKEFYFKPSIWENQPILGKEIFYNKLKETFLTVLPRYFSSKRLIAMSLTGGLDTRMILACIHISPGKLPCYTFGGIYRDCFDVRVARKVADACAQPHEVLRVEKNFFSDFSTYAEKTIYITDGCLGICGSHDLYLNRLAREIAPIRITGKFGSEVLRSASTFKAIHLSERLFSPDFKQYIKKATRVFTAISKGHPLSFTVFKDIPWNEFGRLVIEQSQLTYRSPYMDNDLISLAYQAPVDTFDPKEISLRLINDGKAELRQIITDRGVKVNSDCLFSKYSRLYYELLFKAEYYYNQGMPHWLARINYTFKALNFEKLFLGRHKIEHYRTWYGNELSGYMKEILLDKRTADRPYLNKQFLKEIVDRHVKGDRNYINEIDKTVTVELIYRLLIEQR